MEVPLAADEAALPAVWGSPSPSLHLSASLTARGPTHSALGSAGRERFSLLSQQSVILHSEPLKPAALMFNPAPPTSWIHFYLIKNCFLCDYLI